MSKPKETVKAFTTRMLALALMTSLLISLGTPLTYLCFAWKAKQAETIALAQQIARETQAIIISNPDAKQHTLLQLNNLASFYQQRPDTKHVKIAANRFTSEALDTPFSPSFFDIIHRVDIFCRGTTQGYIEVTTSTTGIMVSTVILTGIFLGLGLLINTLLYRLPVSIVDENEKKMTVLINKLKTTTEELTKTKHQLEQTTIIDCKTGLYNACQSTKRLEEEIAKISLYGGSLAVLMLDIDHFRQYNDHSGHKGGDEAISTIALLIKKLIRTNDLIGRFCGDKFIVILPDIDYNQAISTADRLRSSIAKHRFPEAEFLPSGKLTVSIGGTMYDGSVSLTPQQIFVQAEHALRQAKNSGRNKVVIFQAT